MTMWTRCFWNCVAMDQRLKLQKYVLKHYWALKKVGDDRKGTEKWNEIKIHKFEIGRLLFLNGNAKAGNWEKGREKKKQAIIPIKEGRGEADTQHQA